jgi:hypothetical protein
MKPIITILLFVTTFSIYAQEFGMGMLLDDQHYKDRPLSAPLTRGDYKNLPRSASLKKYTPTPGSQGAYGTCAAWSSAYAGRTILEAMKYNWDKSQIDSNTFSPSFVYNQIRETKGCRNGTSLNDALNILRDQGGVKWKDFGYDCERDVTQKDKTKALGNKIIEYRDIANKYQKNQTSFVKKSLSENKPVIIAMDCPNSFMYAGELWKPDSSDYKVWSQGHGLAVIGYDDDKFGGAFEIINSWGTDWGNGGYSWIRYSDFDYFCVWAFEMIDKTPTDPEIPDLSGTLFFRESNGEEMKASFNGDYFIMEKTYTSGTLFELLISNNEPAYVYAFGSDLTYKTTKIFPFSEKMVAYLPYRQNNIAIPDEDSYNMLDSVVGITYYCFLYSKDKLDLVNIMKKVEDGKGTFWERLTKALVDLRVDKTNIEYGYDGKITFKAKSNGKSVVPVLVSLKHL